MARGRSRLPWIAAVLLGLLGVAAVGVMVIAPDAIGFGPAAGSGPGGKHAYQTVSLDDPDAASGNAGTRGNRSGSGDAGDGTNGGNGNSGGNGSAGGNGQDPTIGDGLSGGGVNVGPGINDNGGGVIGGVTPMRPTDEDGRHFGPKTGYSSSGQVEKDGPDGQSADDETEDPATQNQWRVNFTDGTGPVQVAVGLFRPVPPLEIRADGLYGGGAPVSTNSYATESNGSLALPIDTACGLAGVESGDLTGQLGIYVDDTAYEPIVLMLPLQQGEKPPTITLTRAHYVEIKVRHEVSNKALADAVVELWRYDPANPDGEPMDVLTMRTDSQGLILSRIMPGRSYAFRVRCEGYATTPIERFTCHAEDVHYNLPLYPGDFIAGVVTDEGGNPIAGASVTASQKGNDGDGSDEAMTDAFGQFTVTRVPHNDFSADVWLTVVAPGFSTLVTTALANTENVELVVKTDGAILGAVLAPPPSEGGAGGVLRMPTRVLATQPLYGEKNGYTFPPFLVNADGTFSLSGLVEGEVTLVAESDFGEVSAPLKINYIPGTPVEGITLQLAASAGAFVTVATKEGNGVPGLQVAIGEWRGVTDMAGTVHFTDLKPGKKIPISLVPNEPGASLVTGADGETYFLPAAQQITLQSGQSTEVRFEITIWTPPPVLTPVQVLFSGDSLVGAPGNVKITVTYQSGGVETTNAAVTFANGSAMMDLTIRSDAQTTLEFTHPDYRAVTIPAADLVSAGESQVPVSVPLERQASLSFQVIDPADGNVADCNVRIQRNGKDVANQNTDAAGRVSFTNLDPGPIKILAFKHGYRQAIFDIDVPVLQIIEPMRNDDGSVLEVADTGNGTSSSPSQLQLTISNAGDFHVVVQDENGQPAVGARIWVMRNQKPGSPLEFFDLGKLDGQGGKVVRLHWDVEYQLVVHGTNAIAFAHFFNDPANPVYSMELTMERAADISGTLTDGSGKALENVEVRLTPTDGPIAEAGNYFSAKTNKKGEWKIQVPDNQVYRATVPDKKDTTPVDGLISGQGQVTLIAGQ